MTHRKGDGFQRVLFLCEDNYLHSRFCEELFNSLVRSEGLNWDAASRALSPEAARSVRESMSPDATGYLRSIGVAPVNHLRLLSISPRARAGSSLPGLPRTPRSSAGLRRTTPCSYAGRWQSPIRFRTGCTS